MADHEEYTDPVSGKTIDSSSASTKADYKGKTYYFESIENKQKFESSPLDYIEGDNDDFDAADVVTGDHEDTTRIPAPPRTQ